MTVTTTYGAYGRLVEKQSPNLKCIQDTDKFDVLNINAKLDYPIALITADEVAMAGGVFNLANSNYYLYNGQNFWTLSPATFEAYCSYGLVWFVLPNGGVTRWNNVANVFATRPVINLKADVQIIKGDGTALNPYYVVQS